MANKVYELIRYEVRIALFATKKEAMIAALSFCRGDFRIREWIDSGQYLIFDAENGYVAEAHKTY